MTASQQDKPCPQCGAAMSFRLGEFECASCGHTESAEQPREERGSGPGFRKEQWGGGSSSSSAGSHGNYSLPEQYQGSPVAPPPPPPGSAFYGHQQAYGSPYESAPPPSSGSLDLEKKIYFGLQVASTLIAILVLLAAGPVLQSMGSASGGAPPGAAEVFGFMVVGGIIGGIVNLLLAPRYTNRHGKHPG